MNDIAIKNWKLINSSNNVSILYGETRHLFGDYCAFNRLLLLLRDFRCRWFELKPAAITTGSNQGNSSGECGMLKKKSKQNYSNVCIRKSLIWLFDGFDQMTFRCVWNSKNRRYSFRNTRKKAKVAGTQIKRHYEPNY